MRNRRTSGRCGPVLAFLIGLSNTLPAAAQVATPSTAQQAVERLSEYLGTYDSMRTKLHRIQISRQQELRPSEDEQPISDETEGLTIFGTPYQLAESACFDFVQYHDRSVYRLESEGDRTLLREQQRFLTARVSLYPSESGQWRFQMTNLSHSIPSIVDKTFLSGVVVWQANSVKFEGLGTDQFFRADGSVEPGYVLAELTISVSPEGKLQIADSWQPFWPSEGADSDANLLPDFRNPAGEARVWLTGSSE